MSFQWKFFLLTLFALFSSVSAQAKLTEDELVKLVVAAHGGRSNIEEYSRQTREWKGKFTRSSGQVFSLCITSKEKSYFQTSKSELKTMVFGYDGNVSWIDLSLEPKTEH